MIISTDLYNDINIYRYFEYYKNELRKYEDIFDIEYALMILRLI